MYNMIRKLCAKLDNCKDSNGNYNHESIAIIPELLKILNEVLALDLEDFALLKHNLKYKGENK